MQEEELLLLFEEKKTLLLYCEQLTEHMCICPTDQLEDTVIQREGYIEKLRALDVCIQEIANKQPDLDVVIRNACERRGLSSFFARVYDASLSVKAVANRILSCEGTVRERILIEQQVLLEKIENINTSSSSIAGRYSKSASAGISRPMMAPQGKYI